MADNETASASVPKAKGSTARKAQRKRKTKQGPAVRRSAGIAAFPRHAVKKALRIPKAILEQNAGKACSDREAVLDDRLFNLLGEISCDHAG